MLKCAICGKRFKNKKAIEKHFYLEHSSIMQSEREKLQEKIDIIKNKIAIMKKEIKKNEYD